MKTRSTDVEKADSRQRVRSSDDIPFGSKAMLEDPDIEGVWNSQASTPLQSPILAPRSSSHTRMSLNLFSRSRRNCSVSSLSHLDHPQRSPSDASVEAESPDPRYSSGASSCALLPQRKDSQDTPWEHQVSVSDIQSLPVPRRRSVTIRANSKSEVITRKIPHGKRKPKHLY